jgi:hypothetical protein
MNAFASSYEVRMARILKKNKIGFIYGRSFIVERNGDVVRRREVDFILRNIQIWSAELGRFVNCVEVKGAHIDKRARTQQKELKDRGIYTAIFDKKKIFRCERERRFFTNLLRPTPVF